MPINLNILSGESEVLQKIGQDYQELKLHLIENTIRSISDAVMSRLAMPLLMVTNGIFANNKRIMGTSSFYCMSEADKLDDILLNGMIPRRTLKRSSQIFGTT